MFRLTNLLSLSVFFICNGIGQNLVPNPSFEKYLDCPDGKAQTIEIQNWYNPTLATPDYFNSCSNQFAGVPVNQFGEQLAHTGNAYVGFAVSNNENGGYREYLQCMLTNPLIHGEEYIIEFSLSLADAAMMACDRFGVFLSEESITMPMSNAPLEVSPQYETPISLPLTDVNNWQTFRDTLTANGGEFFLTIGIFPFDDGLTMYKTQGDLYCCPYYFLDDVLLERLETVNIGESRKDIELITNLIDSAVLTIIVNEEVGPIEIYSQLGQLVLQVPSIPMGVSDLDVSGLSAGAYILLFWPMNGIPSSLRFTKVN